MILDWRLGILSRRMSAFPLVGGFVGLFVVELYFYFWRVVGA